MMGTTNSTSKKTDWDAILATQEMKKASINFALGILSGATYKDLGVICGCGSHTRNLVRPRGATKARELVRKALRRRNMLNKFNLVDPLVYALKLLGDVVVLGCGDRCYFRCYLYGHAGAP